MQRHCPIEISTPFKGNCLEISSYGKYLIFGSVEGRISVVDKDTKENLYDVLLEGGPIYSIALSKSDLFLIVGGKDGKIRKFDYVTFQEMQTFHGHEKDINSVILSYDGNFIFSASDDGTIRKFNINTNDNSIILYTHEKPALCLDCSENGNFMASGSSDKLIKIYDFHQEKVTHILTEFTSSIWSVKISDNNKLIAAGDNKGRINIWSTHTMKIIYRLIGHNKRITHLEFNDTQELLISSSNDYTLRIWDLVEDKNELILTGHTDWIKSFKISKDQKFIYSIAENFKIMCWLFPMLHTPSRQKAHTQSIFNICYSRTNDYLFTADITEIKVWDLATRTVYATLKNSYNVAAMCMNSDNCTLIVAYSNNELHYWNIEELISMPYIIHPSTIKVILASPDNRYIVCGDINFRVTIYSKQNYLPVIIFRTHHSTISSLAFSKPVHRENDQLFSGGEDHKIFMYALSASKSFKFCGHAAPVTALCVSRNNELLISGDQDGIFKIWHILTQDCFRTVIQHTEKITGIYFSENSKYFWISSCDSSLSLWNSTSFTEVTRLKTKYPALAFCTSKNEVEILVAENEDISFIENPLRRKEFCIYGPGREYYSFMKYLVEICEGNIREHSPEMDKWIIAPYEINALHFYAYFNLPRHLKSAMNCNSPFYFSKMLYSPLQIAIHRNFRECINVIIKCIRIKVKEYPYSVGYIEDSILKLNEVGFKGLDEFYDSILFETKSKLLPKFCIGKVNLPLIVFSRTITPHQKDFFVNKEISLYGKALSFWQSALNIDVIIGSSDSILFLESLIACPNTQIFKTKFVIELILYKWKYVKIILLPQALLFSTYMFWLSYYLIFEDQNNDFLVYLTFILNSMLASYELFQLFLTKKKYLQDIWNYVDVIRIFLCFIYIIFIWTEFDIFITKQVLVSLTFVSMIHGISYFRLFDSTRYIIKLLGEVIKDMISFLILLTYSTFSFALMYFIMVNNIIESKDDRESFSAYMAKAYLLNLGSFDTDYHQTFEWVIFFFASVINPLIMLNLLISIMGDTYSRVKDERDIANMIELTEMIIEGEYLLFCKRNQTRKSYMQICKEETVTEIYKSPQDRLEKIKNRIKQITKNMKIKHEKVRLELNVHMGSVNRKLDQMTNLIEHIHLTQD